MGGRFNETLSCWDGFPRGRRRKRHRRAANKDVFSGTGRCKDFE